MTCLSAWAYRTLLPASAGSNSFVDSTGRLYQTPSGKPSETVVSAVLDKWGREGWELVDTDGATRWILKRPRLSSIDHREFLQQRRVANLQVADGDGYMVLAAPPPVLTDDELIDVTSPRVLSVMRNPPRAPKAQTAYDAGCGAPIPTLEGLRAGRPTSHLLVCRNGYIELGTQMRAVRDEALLYAALVFSEMLVSFVGLAEQVYQGQKPPIPVVFTWEFYNGSELRLAQGAWGGNSLPLGREHMNLGEFVTENVDAEASNIPKRMSDRLWNAFGFPHAGLFAPGGVLAPP